jgi:hypothetical protein
MGQQSIIIAVLASFLLTMAVGSMMGAWDMSTDTIATQFEEEQAMNVANSGINLAISTLRQTKTWRAGYTNLAVANGSATVRITDLGTDSVRINSTGTYGTATRTAVVHAKLSSIFPTAESALTIFGDSVEFDADGKSFLIDGRDYLADGSTFGTHDPVYGIAVTANHITDYLKTDLTADAIGPNVQGKGGAPSVGTFSKSNLDSLMNLYRTYATVKLPAGKYSGNAVYGSLDNPQIVHVAGNLEWTGTITGAGILIVDGALLMAGKVSWQGIVMALSGDVTLQLGASGTPSIIGSTFIGSKNVTGVTKVHVNGNPAVKYSHSVLETVLAKLNLLQVEVSSYWE